MARVQMLVYVSGGRGDGSEWPEPGGVLVCGDAEARDLVGAQLARWAPGGEERAVLPPGSGDEPAGAQDGQDGQEDPASPAVRAAKQAWVDHAVTQGCDPAEAAAMTKADLIAQYGNPAA